MDELRVWDILDEEPVDLDGARPLVGLLPEVGMSHAEFHFRNHLGDPTEMLRLVDAEEKEDLGIFEFIESLWVHGLRV